MPNKRMQFPKLPELQNENLTAFERFRLLAKRVVSVPKGAVKDAKKDKPQPSS
jgi:hypothetical protein